MIPVTPLKYSDMVDRILFDVVIPDGFNGDTLTVGMAYVDSTWYAVAPCGYYRFPLHVALQVEVKSWL